MKNEEFIKEISKLPKETIIEALKKVLWMTGWKEEFLNTCYDAEFNRLMHILEKLASESMECKSKKPKDIIKYMEEVDKKHKEYERARNKLDEIQAKRYGS